MKSVVPAPTARAADRAAWRRVYSSNLSLALLACLPTLVVYLRTLLPDLGGFEDTPKFQYLGAVLGTAHRPGYPLYVLLSHAFSYLPFGTIAYRADLMSAVAGSVAVAHVVLLARLIGCSRPAAVFGALMLGFGAAFWTYAVLAEVYTLATALLLAVMYWMVRWGRSGRAAHLYIASAFFALALGNHLSIVMTGPAIAAYLLVAPARRTLTARTVVTAGAIVVSGFLQYLYVLIRTVQGADFVEANARTASQLLELIDAGSYSEFVLPFSWHNLAFVYLPRLWYYASEQYGLIGIGVLGLGAAILCLRDWRAMLLLAVSTVGTIGLSMQLFGDTRGFFVPVWGLGAVYLAAGADGLSRTAGRAPGRLPAVALAVVLLLYPVRPLLANFEANDWSRRTDDARFLRAVLRDLPSPAALVREEYVTDSMLAYLRAIEGGKVWEHLSRPPIDPAAVQSIFERGYPVFALGEAYKALSSRGFDFTPVSVPVESMASRIATLPAGTVVALAGRNTRLPVDVAERLDVDPVRYQRSRGTFMAMVTRVGSPPSEFVTDDQAAIAELRLPQSGTRESPQRLLVRADADGALIFLDDQVVDGVAEGLVVAVLDRDGQSVATYRPVPPESRVTGTSRFRLYRMRGLNPAFSVGGRTWTEVTPAVRDGLLNVIVDNFRAFDARFVLYASSEHGLRPSLDGRHAYGPVPTFDGQTFDRNEAADRQSLERILAADGLQEEQLGDSRFVARVEQTVNDGGDSASWSIALGAAPTTVWAYGITDLPNPRRVAVVPPPVTRFLLDEDLSVVNASGYHDWMFGAGWHRPERDSTGEFRWASALDAYLLLPIAAGTRDVHLTLTTRLGPTPDPEPSVTLVFNDLKLEPCRLQPGWQRCTWVIPADHVHDGVNSAIFRSSSVGRPAGATDPRHMGHALRQILLRR